jgi:hypothetical protein
MRRNLVRRSRNAFGVRRLSAVAVAALIGCGGDGASGPERVTPAATLTLTVRGFAGQPAMVASHNSSGLRYAGTRVALRVTRPDGSALVERNVTAEEFTYAVVGGEVVGTAEVAVPISTGAHTVTGEIFNGANERLYTLASTTAQFDAAGEHASADVPLTYVGPGQDIVAVALEAENPSLEVYQFSGVVCRGTRSDGTTTTDFPRLLSTRDGHIATVNPTTGLLAGHLPGETNVTCRIAFGNLAQAELPVVITNRSPTPAARLVLESPAPLASGENWVVSVGTRIVIKVRAIDSTGNYAAWQELDAALTNAAGPGGSLQPSGIVITGNDGTVELVMTVGQQMHNARVMIPGTTTLGNPGSQVSVVRYGN